MIKKKSLEQLDDLKQIPFDFLWETQMIWYKRCVNSEMSLKMINPKKEMIEINGLLLLHQKTKALLVKKINDLLIVLDTAEAKSKLHKQEIDKVTAKAKEILNYLNKWFYHSPILLGTFTFVVAMDKN